ncbi:MAG: signal peptidase II [Elusimicrobiota bacterium]
MIYYTIMIVFVIDRLIKLLVTINIPIGGRLEVFPFLNITHIYNTGAAFSLLTGKNNILIVINVLLTTVLLAFLIFFDFKRKEEKFAFALIAAGSLSNVADRLMHAGVIDYIDISIWPVFNIADVSITAGALIIASGMIKEALKKKKVVKNAS